MNKLLNRIVSLALTLALAADPGAAAFAGVLSRPATAPYRAAARFQEDALALFPLAAVSITVRPFTNFWNQLQLAAGGSRYSQIQLGSQHRAAVEQNMNVLNELLTVGTNWIGRALASDRTGTSLATQDRAMLHNIHRFLTHAQQHRLLTYQTFPEKFKDRMIASYRAPDGRKWIVVNPLYTQLLRNLLQSPDGDFLAADLLIDEVPELILENNQMNRWSKETDIDEPWAEAFILKQKSNLWRLWKDMNRPSKKEGFVRLDTLYGSILDPARLAPYLTVMHQLAAGLPSSLHLETPDKQNELWETIFTPFLALNYDPAYLMTPIGDHENRTSEFGKTPGLNQRWRWAARQLLKEPYPQEVQVLLGISNLPSTSHLSSRADYFHHVAPKDLPKHATSWREDPDAAGSKIAWRFSQTPINGNGGPSEGIVQSAINAAMAVYLDAEKTTGPADAFTSNATAMKYNEYMEQLGLKPDPDVLASAYLLQLDDKDFLKIKLSRENDKQRLATIIHRVNAAIRTPYIPPEGVYEIEPNATTNHMARYRKMLPSLDELLLMIARKMAALEDTGVPEETKRALNNEVQLIIGPLMNRLGMRVLGEQLRNQAFHAVDPARYNDLESIFQQNTGMTRVQAAEYETRLSAMIAEKLPAESEARVSGSPKTPASMQRKHLAKFDEYREYTAMEDLLRFRIVLKRPADLGAILTAIGGAAPFASEAVRATFTKKGVPEAKKLPGYNAYHVTFMGEINGKLVPHEIQIFMRPEDYYEYEYGWPNAWWAYAIQQLTGHRPDFEKFAVNDADPRGNYMNFGNAVDAYTYFSISTDFGEGGKIQLIPSRVLNNGGARGNVADAAVRSGHFSKNIEGALRYIIDPQDQEHRWAKKSRNFIPLDFVLKDHDVLIFSDAQNPFNAQDAILRKTERSASSLRTVIEIRSAFTKDYPKLLAAGRLQLADTLRRDLGMGKKKVLDLANFYDEKVLNEVAVANGFKSAHQLLAVFGLVGLDPFFTEQREGLRHKIIAATQTYGAHLLNERVESNHTLQLLDEVARDDAFKFPSGMELLLAVGLGQINAAKVSAALGKARARSSIAQAALTGGPAAQKFLTITPIRKDTGADPYYEIEVALDNDQSGTMAELTDIVARHGGHFVEGSRSEPTKEGALLRLVIEKEHIDIDALIQAIGELQITSTSPSTRKSRRFTVALQLSNSPDAANAVFKRLKTDMPDTNISWFAIDQPDSDGRRWLNLTLAIPQVAEDRTSPHGLRGLLRKMKREPGSPITHFEVGPSFANDATVQAMDETLNNEGLVVRQYRRLISWIQALIWTPSLDEDLDRDEIDQAQVDSTLLADFRRALDLAKRIHSIIGPDGVRRPEMRRNGEAYIVHPMSVASLVIREGIRDPVILIAALLHDALENGPRNRFQETHRGEKIPGFDDLRMQAFREDIIQEIAETFPEMAHRLLYTLDYVSNYKTGGYSPYARKLRDRGGIGITALKLADMIDNLRTIYEVEKTSDWTPQRQVAKRIRFGLALVAWSPRLKNAAYRNPRIEFLKTLAEQSADLALDDFMEPYYQSNEITLADRQKAREETLQNIADFMNWLSQNTDWLPASLKDTNFDRLISRLGQMRDLLGQSPSLATQTNDPSQELTRAWFQDTTLEKLFSFRFEQGTDHLLRGDIMFSKPGSPMESASLTLSRLGTLNRVQGPTLSMMPKSFRPYSAELLRVLLRWVRERGFPEVEFPENNFPALKKFFDALRADPSVAPYRIETDPNDDHEARYFVVSLADLDLDRPKPSTETRGIVPFLGPGLLQLIHAHAPLSHYLPLLLLTGLAGTLLALRHRRAATLFLRSA